MSHHVPLLKEFETGLGKALAGISCSLPDLEGKRLAVAVSGGADSMALVYLLAAHFGPGSITALSVDHGLRAEAAREVEQVEAWMGALDIRHVALRWEGEKPQSSIQEAARAARYGLMESWCRAHQVDFLFLGHHRRDQAETFLLRLARGSGIWGLSAMAYGRSAFGKHEKPYLMRPMLDMDYKQLRAYLNEKSQPWIEDPSNQDLAYDRVKTRQFLSDPPLEGLNEQRMAGTAKALARARDALEHYMQIEADKLLAWSPYGSVTFEGQRLAQLPDEIALRLLSYCVQKTAALDKPPRLSHIENWLEGLRHNEGMGRTLSGCEVLPARHGEVTLCREIARIEDAKIQCESGQFLWDGRFEIELDAVPENAFIGKLGEAGWTQLKKEGFEAPCPFKLALSQPALWQGEMLCAAPTLGYNRKDVEVKIYARFIL